MCFRRKIHNGIEAVLLEKRLNLRPFRHITADKLVAGIGRHFLHVTQIACIREQVKVHHVDVFASAYDKTDEAGADKASPTCYQNFHH